MTSKTITTRTRTRTARDAHGAIDSTHVKTGQWGIIGNAPIIAQLQRMVSAGPDSHAFLISGPSGIGKTTLATSFARALICTRPLSGNACEKCENCVASSAHRHPDLITITDEEDSLGIEQIRGITASLQRRPTLSARHVVLIDRVERMTEEASNAFLKTLEEPYGGTVFILTTNSVHLVPQTIVSRCAVFHCALVPDATIKEHLIEVGIDAAHAFQITALADGRPAYAMRLATQQGAYDQAIEDAESLLTLISAVPHERIRIAETIAAHKEEPARMAAVLDRWESTMRRMLKVAAGQPDNGPSADAIRTLVASTMTLPAIVLLAQQLQQMRDRIRTSGNLRLNIESFSLHLPTTRL